MKSIAELSEDRPNSISKIRPEIRLARRLLLAKLKRLTGGQLRLIEPEGELVFGSSPQDLPPATLRIHNPSFFTKVIFGGSIGAAESYMAGDWSSDNLTAVIRLLVRNRPLVENLEHGWARIMQPLRQALHRLRANTRRGSRRNIEEHYDLGNDFFELFLDPTLMYSCALFERPEMTLLEASEAKLERICGKLDLKESDHVLEIGSGWGGFATYAAKHYGCRVTTTTISPAQYQFTCQRVRAAGLEHRVEVLDRDYRDLEGEFDKLVSIEMVEAVGLQYLDGFFHSCSERLKAGGLMVLQSITIADRFFERARDSVDFIQRYIFPGSAIPSISALGDSVARSTDMTLIHLEDIGPHYAETLRRWRRSFLKHREEVRNLGFSDRFIRMWEFYFCYCEGGFRERSIGDAQMVLAKPLNRRPSILGQLS